MKVITNTISTQPVKKAYKKPKLFKHGKVSRITLKIGSMIDADMTVSFKP